MEKMKYFVGMVVWSLTLFKCTLAHLNIGGLLYWMSWICEYYSSLFIAIIGGGIGGTSCAYFLKEIFNDSAKIDIYEGNKVGGRLATVVMNDGNEYETGGSVIHQRNKYMSDFVKKFGELSDMCVL